MYLYDRGTAHKSSDHRETYVEFFADNQILGAPKDPEKILLLSKFIILPRWIKWVPCIYEGLASNLLLD